jgi:tRNA (cmo5U34)-methyltransferase
MSLVQERGNDPVHFPKRRDVFQFDEEIAAIFPNMAVRSIPMYAEVHRLHAALLHRMFHDRCALDVLDVGASRGHFLREICKRFQSAFMTGWLKCFAMDNSRPMLELIRGDMPAVHTIEADVTTLPDLGRRFDVISLLYVLQFIPEDRKVAVLQWAYDSLRPGGVLLLGQKENAPEGHNYMNEEYIQFRVDNGYTREEIEAKTKALQGSMWCMGRGELHAALNDVGFVEITDTSRWLMFSTILCRK